MCANAVWMPQEKRAQTCSWRPHSDMAPVETSLLWVLLSPCDLSTQTQPGALSLLAHQTPAHGDGRAQGGGQRKCCFYFHGLVSALSFITAQSQLCTQGFGFFLQHSLHLKTEMCACVCLLRVGKVGLSPLLVLLCTHGWLTLPWWPSWTLLSPGWLSLSSLFLLLSQRGRAWQGQSWVIFQMTH